MHFPCEPKASLPIGVGEDAALDAQRMKSGA